MRSSLAMIALAPLMLFGVATPVHARSVLITMCGSAPPVKLRIPMRDGDHPAGPSGCHAAAVIAAKKKRL
ncbi:hypothetical protein [Sphingosinicella sp. BN140058]|uniref:hypothetical protein n=1 Tax=Sphingosinicella sp. BN140058 TaxID=1892855 RepID=UPI0010138862|nr:hypothetical protein [Sphingosinicella sp. BN140058]QAY78733.1 hypothetical protein ETR14_20945 [Sphingosinicella sp. BN140058]